jgi:hypothetical protein
VGNDLTDFGHLSGVIRNQREKKAYVSINLFIITHLKGSEENPEVFFSKVRKMQTEKSGLNIHLY